MLRRTSLAAALLTLPLGVLAPPAALAAGVSVCTYDATAHDLTIQGPVGPGHVAVANLKRTASGGFVLNGDACDAAASVTTVDRVVVAGTTAVRVALDEGDGTFEPGLGAEAGGTAEIEFAFAPGVGPVELDVRGTHDADRMLAGVGGLDMNGDGDVDVDGADLTSLTLEGRSGNDALSTMGGGATGGAFAGDATLDGGAGDDTLHQANLDGTGHAARLMGGPGADAIDGSGGRSSVLDFSAATAAIRLDLRAGRAAGEGDDRIHGVSSVKGSRFGDRLVAGAGAAFLAGGAGNDMLSVGAGGGSFDGGPGIDVVSFGQAHRGVRVSLATMHARRGPAIAAFEAVIGSRQRDVLIGDGRRNVLDGGGGDDALYGGRGADRLSGGPGADRLDGGTGRDRCRQGPGQGAMRGCEG